MSVTVISKDPFFWLTSLAFLHFGAFDEREFRNHRSATVETSYRSVRPGGRTRRIPDRDRYGFQGDDSIRFSARRALGGKPTI